MLSEYFLKKIETEKFKLRLINLLESLKDKKVLLYGFGELFFLLNEKYNITNLNIVAVADKKFEEETFFKGFKAIPPEQIFYQDYDVILIADKAAPAVANYLKKTMKITDKQIVTILEEAVPDEQNSCNYLNYFDFRQNIYILSKKLKNKKVIIYGAGIMFEAMKEYFDLSKLNIIGISDKKFSEHEENQKFLGYKVYAPQEIKQVKPDYVLVSTKIYIKIIEDLYYNILKGSKIKIKPLIKKPFKVLMNEIWNRV